MVPVKVKLPALALGMVTAPVPTVIVPELFRVVLTVKVLLPIAKVPADRVKVVAVTLPSAVPPLDKVNVV